MPRVTGRVSLPSASVEPWWIGRGSVKQNPRTAAPGVSPLSIPFRFEVFSRYNRKKSWPATVGHGGSVSDFIATGATVVLNEFTGCTLPCVTGQVIILEAAEVIGG